MHITPEHKLLFRRPRLEKKKPHLITRDCSNFIWIFSNIDTTNSSYITPNNIDYRELHLDNRD